MAKKTKKSNLSASSFQHQYCLETKPPMLVWKCKSSYAQFCKVSVKQSKKMPRLTGIPARHEFHLKHMPKSGNSIFIHDDPINIYSNLTQLNIRICRENTTCTFIFPVTLWPWSLVKATKTGMESIKLSRGLRFCHEWTDRSDEYYHYVNSHHSLMQQWGSGLGVKFNHPG